MSTQGTGYVDLHSHYLPAVDDGVSSFEEGLELCRGLHSIGYERVVATPHIRTAMFDNRAPDLRSEFERFTEQASAESGMPQTGLGAEHYCDDVFLRLFEGDQALTYPGGKALLIEFPAEQIPHSVEQIIFRMTLKGVAPVLAHPERYRPLFRKTEAIERMLQMGVLPLLDLMSLQGKYGRRPRRAAERMLEEEVYAGACSDAHKPQDVERVQQAIDRLIELIGAREAARLLSDGPRAILQGSAAAVR